MSRKTGILLFLYAVALLAARAAFGDVERTLRAEIPDAGRAAFAVENLVGTMRVVPGSGETATIVATVHAENDALAGSVRLEKTSGEGGTTTFHVQYPDSERTLRYPRHGGDGDGSWSIELFSWGDGTRYQGHNYRIARNRGTPSLRRRRSAGARADRVRPVPKPGWEARGVGSRGPAGVRRRERGLEAREAPRRADSARDFRRRRGVETSAAPGIRNSRAATEGPRVPRRAASPSAPLRAISTRATSRRPTCGSDHVRRRASARRGHPGARDAIRPPATSRSIRRARGSRTSGSRRRAAT